MRTPYYILTAGCNSFPGMPGRDLRGCIADAHRMAETLLAALGDPVRYRILVDTSRFDFIMALQTARDMALAGEVEYVAVAVSTHGTWISDGEHGNACTALVFSDATMEARGLLPDWQLKEILDSFPLTCRVECWFDTCHSGTISRGALSATLPHATPRSIPAGTFSPVQPQRIRQGGGLKSLSRGAARGQGSNIVAWGGCLDSEESADAPDGNGGFCGAFTRAWCDVFSENTQRSRWDMLPLVTAAIAEAGFPQQHPTLSAQRSEGA